MPHARCAASTKEIPWTTGSRLGARTRPGVTALLGGHVDFMFVGAGAAAEEIGYLLEADPSIRTMLELGSGAGHNAFFLKKWYQMTLTDLSPEMLAVSRRTNPDCEHALGDMRSLRLGRAFDAVFIHDAIMFLTTLADLQKAFATAFAHLKPGGTLLVTPDFVQETFAPSTECGGSDGADGRALRYLEWTADPDPADNRATVHYAYLMKLADGSTTVEHETFAEGVFPTEQWLEALRSVGFHARAFPEDQYNRINFIATRPR